MGISIQAMRPTAICVTPETAREWLSHNYEKNRKIRKFVVDKYAEDMKQCKWKEAMPDSIICFTTDGKLLNGQHRLSAIINSNTSHTFWVANNVPVEYYYEMDNGTPRRTSDYIEGKYAANCSALASRILKLKNGISAAAALNNSGNHKLSRAAILETMNENEELIRECACQGQWLTDKNGCGAPADYAMFVYLVKAAEQDEFLEEFMNEFGEILPHAQPVALAKQAILTKYAKKKVGERMCREWVIGTLLQAYDAYAEGKDIASLNKAKTSVEKYFNLVREKLGINKEGE